MYDVTSWCVMKLDLRNSSEDCVEKNGKSLCLDFQISYNLSHRLGKTTLVGAMQCSRQLILSLGFVGLKVTRIMNVYEMAPRIVGRQPIWWLE